MPVPSGRQRTEKEREKTSELDAYAARVKTRDTRGSSRVHVLVLGLIRESRRCFIDETVNIEEKKPSVQAEMNAMKKKRSV